MTAQRESVGYRVPGYGWCSDDEWREIQERPHQFRPDDYRCVHCGLGMQTCIKRRIVCLRKDDPRRSATKAEAL